MKYIFLLIVLSLSACCNSQYPVEEKAKEKYVMKCTSGDLAKGSWAELARCENDEVICYAAGHGLQCKFKQP